MAEESKLVEEVVETTETTKEEGVKDAFNPLAFSDDVYGELDAEKETKETTSESGEQTEEQSEEDGWAWDKKEKAKEAVKEEEDYNWDDTQEKSEETSETEEALTWSKVGKELGIEINSKDEFVNTLNSYTKELQSKQQAPGNDQTSELRSYLNFSDRDLIAEELRADGIEDSEIEDSLDKLEDSGMMKMKAKSIRRVINNAIDQQTTQAKQQATQQQEQQKKGAENAKKELKGQIKNMNEFMGGKVTKKQKEEVYRYATGDMMKEIYADHANVADVAMFMLYRKQIEKILRSQGLEDGKAAIMDSIVSPNLNTGKSKSNFQTKTGKFDPKAFMSE